MKFYHGTCFIKGQKTRFTVAFEKVDDKTIKMGFATCSPIDRFQKKIGREKAAKNLTEIPIAVTTPWDLYYHSMNWDHIYWNLSNSHNTFPGIPRKIRL